MLLVKWQLVVCSKQLMVLPCSCRTCAGEAP
jgi:hypothetical protein